MDNQINLSLNKSSDNHPYWPALKLILSSLIVFNFYFHLINQPELALIINAFNLSLIPMFVFIVAFVTKSTTWQIWRHSLIPALIIYFSFQTLDAIPLYFSDKLDLKTYLISPQNGVWFFLATPIWQAFFLLLPAELKNHRLCLLTILAIALVAAFSVKNDIAEISDFFSIIYFFPFFVLAYFINPGMVFRWRNKNSAKIIGVIALAIGCLYFQNDANHIISTAIIKSALLSQFIAYLISLLIGILLGMVIIYLASASDKYEKITNNALGIYLIHPIICFVFLTTLSYFHFQLNVFSVIILALITIILALWLASKPAIHWFINPVFGPRAE